MQFNQSSSSQVTLERFEELVQEALDSIPNELWNMIDNLVVVVDDWPSRTQLAAADIPAGHTLLGLYEGVPLTGRNRSYGLIPPDKITIFRRPILRHSPRNDEDAIRAQVRRTVLHEVAHHFGISDDRLHEIDAY